MWPFIVVIAVFLIFLMIVGVLFLKPLIVVGSNLIVLYFLSLRIHTEITKYDRGDIYVYSAIASLLVILIVGNFLPLWWVTTAAFLSFVFTHLYILTKKS